jgi:hypothetical protein
MVTGEVSSLKLEDAGSIFVGLADRLAENPKVDESMHGTQDVGFNIERSEGIGGVRDRVCRMLPKC